MDSVPLVIFTSLTVKSCTELLDGSAAGVELFPPKLAKFQAPYRIESDRFAGKSISMPVTLSFFEKIRGWSSTPTFNDLAWMNGALLNAASSAIERSAAATPPEKIESFRSPSLTLRASAWVRAASRRGRNWLASIRKGRASAINTRSATTIASQRRVCFMGKPPIYKVYTGRMLLGRYFHRSSRLLLREIFTILNRPRTGVMARCVRGCLLAKQIFARREEAE